MSATLDLAEAFAAFAGPGLPRREALTDHAEALGYRRFHAAGRTLAFYAANGLTVLKASFGDPAYAAFARYAQANADDPHLPKIDQAARFDSGLALYAIEALDPSRLAETYCDFAVALDLGPLAPAYLARDAAAFRAGHASFCASVERVCAARPTWCANDLAIRNMRMRGDVPVILDPWC